MNSIVIIIVSLLLISCVAHIFQAYQSLKDFSQEITPLLIFAVVTLSLAVLLVFDVPYALYIALIFMLIGGVGGGNQIMRLDRGGCMNWGIVVLNLIIIGLLMWSLVVGM